MSLPPRTLGCHFLGRVPYARAVELQEEARRRLRAGESGDQLLLLEHPHVYTFGRNAERADLLVGDAWLAARGVETADCDRGGQVTYHGPGQLVGYPILDLDPDRRDLRAYVHDLLEVLVRTLSDFRIAAEARHEAPAIGVWVGGRKIASVGVHVARWITTHGFALNVTTDLDYFRGIVPCGMPDAEICSIASETGTRPPLAEVASTCARRFGEVFGYAPAPDVVAWPTVS